MNQKCFGTHDSEVEAINRQDIEKFSNLMSLKDASEVFANMLLQISPLIESEQKFKNLASLTLILLDKVHQSENFSIGLKLIDIGN